MLSEVSEFPLLLAPYDSRLAIFRVDTTLPMVYSGHQKQDEREEKSILLVIIKDKDSIPITVWLTLVAVTI